jgi:hypothetical protein
MGQWYGAVVGCYTSRMLVGTPSPYRPPLLERAALNRALRIAEEIVRGGTQETHLTAY